MAKKILPGTENITPIDETKEPTLSQKRRNEIMRQLNENGISSENLSDGELLDKLAEAYQRLQTEHIKAIAPALDRKLEDYGNDPACRITDKKFLERLYRMNVYKECLKMFVDADVSLSDAQIWTEIRFSGFRPIHEVTEVMKMRGKMNPPGNKRKMRNFE
jgi:hypothetical protein